MSGTGEAWADFAGEERAFRIRLGEIRAIEAKCGVGIGEVLRRLSRCVLLLAEVGGGTAALAAGVEIYADDVREPIYQGLIGAGMGSAEASKLLRSELDNRGVRGVLDNAGTALSVLWGSQSVPEDSDLGESRAGESPATSKSDTISPASTEPPPS